MRALICVALLIMTGGATAQSGSGLTGLDTCVPADIPMEQGFVTSADGTRLYYRKLGRGRPTAIYLHGGPGGTIYNGGCEIAPLARHHPLVLYDQRGGGRSDLVSDPGRLEARDHIADLDAVRRHFGVRSVSLIGLSWGSGLAILYADAHPGRVRKLLLLAPMPIARKPFGDERNAAVERAAGAELLERRRQLQQQMQGATTAEEVVALCRRISIEAPMPYVLDAARHRTLTGCDYPAEVIRNRAVVQRHTLQSLGEWDFRPALRRLRVPVLVMEGAQSVVPLTSPSAWAATARRGRLLLVPNAGHEVGMDQPEAVLTAARRFLRGQWPRDAHRA